MTPCHQTCRAWQAWGLDPEGNPYSRPVLRVASFPVGGPPGQVELGTWPALPGRAWLSPVGGRWGAGPGFLLASLGEPPILPGGPVGQASHLLTLAASRGITQACVHANPPEALSHCGEWGWVAGVWRQKEGVGRQGDSV